MPTATASPQKIIDLAKTQVGYHEGRTSGHWNNIQKYAGDVPGLEWANGQAWCATFVSWLALRSGLTDLYPRTASCDVAGAWFKKAGRWSLYPAIGAQVFYGTAADLNHTGLVVAYNATTIWTVEGNTNDDGGREGDGVYLKTRPRLRSNIVGYGYPAFPEGIVSADPAWARQAPKPTPPAMDRGARVEGAIDDLEQAKGRGVRRQRIRRALRELRGIPADKLVRS